MKEEIGRSVIKFIYDIASIDARIVYLVILIVIAVMVLDAVFGGAAEEKKQVGLGGKTQTIYIDGTKTLPVRDYVSVNQGIAGKPDAVISENGFIVPVETKPLARKLRDRYIAQLLVYMRLIEEFEGVRPPYGYLILGPNHKRFKIENSEQRQKWLQKMLDEMRSVLDQTTPAKPLPEKRKCSRCSVKEACQFRGDLV